MPKSHVRRHSGAGRRSSSQSSFPRKRESSVSQQPESWLCRPLGEVVKTTKGRKPGLVVPHAEPDALPYATTDYFRNGTASTYVPKTALNSVVPCRAGVPILIWDGSNAGEVFIGKRAVLASTMARIDVDTNVLSSIFCYFFLKTVFDVLNERTTGSTIPHVSRHTLESLQVPTPPKPEQEKIAAVLWKVQRAIATQDRLIAATCDLKASAMQHLFTHGLHNEPLKDTEIGPMPESWLVASLSAVAQLARGRFTHRPRNEPRFYGGATPFVQTGDVVRSQGHITEFTQTLNEDGVAISRVFPKGTILITIAANIGFVGILTFDSACPDSLVGITPSETMDGQFLTYYLQKQQPEMDRLAPKGTQKNINIQFLDPWPVAVPDLDEQRSIATALAGIDRKLAHHRKKRAALNDLFQTLLHKLMTAEIRVNNLDIDTSEVTDHFADVSKMAATGPKEAAV